MARPLRLEYPGATYHIISRGNNQSVIFQGKSDRLKFLELLGKAHQKYSLKFFAYCLMDNHYHLLVETLEPNISKAMQYLNSVYTSYYNWVHKQSGHLLQGRFKSILVEKDPYLLELTRYIHLNPVRAEMVRHPSEYAWSSYRYYLGWEKRPIWLHCQEIFSQFSNEESQAIDNYAKFIEDRMAENLSRDPLQGVMYQSLLGNKPFVENLKVKSPIPSPEISYGRELKTIAPEKILERVKKLGLDSKSERKLGIYALRTYSSLSLREICALFGGGHYSRISQMVKRLELNKLDDKKFNATLAALRQEMSNVKV